MINKYIKYKTKYLNYKTKYLNSGNPDSNSMHGSGFPEFITKSDTGYRPGPGPGTGSKSAGYTPRTDSSTRPETMLNYIYRPRNESGPIPRTTYIFIKELPDNFNSILKLFLDRAKKYKYVGIYINFDIIGACLAINQCNEYNIFDIFNNFIEDILRIIYLNIPYNNNKLNLIVSINWFKFTGFASNQINILCVLREYIICLVIITAYKINNLYSSSITPPNIIIPLPLPLHRQSLLKLIDNKCFEVAISGSDEPLSDIDININALNNTSFWLAIIEDLLGLIPWFNHTAWRVDFYSDISLFMVADVSQKYINFHCYTSDTRIKLLEYTLLSYYKNNMDSSKLSDFASNTEQIKLLKSIANIYFDEKIIAKFNFTNLLQNIVNIKNLDPEPYREKYYTELLIMDNLTSALTDPTKMNPDKQRILANSIALQGAELNLYREENYLTLDTFIHIVKCNQALQPTDNEIQTVVNSSDSICKGIIANPNCNNLPIYSYIFSAIENFGFMTHNLDDTVICNLAANKYFDRILDAFSKILIITNADQIPATTDINKYKMCSKEIIQLKKTRSMQGLQEKDCDTYTFDLLLKLTEVVNLMPKGLMNPLVLMPNFNDKQL